ncbi:MAG: CDP-diacylglycerol--glycerol-3-phosphate 3-phosphatidyltransferase [Acidimicrobiia bacterium]|nr:CDP-diacylglycerol--glycerol-3-phosphate 3-phosphatidyltransferase [Acidimicrobiia bacterium]
MHDHIERGAIQSDESTKEHRISLPDLLAFARIVMVPIIMWLVTSTREHALGAAAVLFLIAAATDFFDGYLARRWGITTVLGAFLDSTADKLLVSGTLIALVAIERASIWPVLIIIMREFTVMALRGITAMEGHIVKPSMFGKVKANIQFGAIVFAMLRFSQMWGPLYFDEWLMWLAAGVAVASGWQYASGFWHIVRKIDSKT